MACEDCARRRRELMSAIFQGKLAEAKEITVEGLRVMISVDASADHRNYADAAPPAPKRRKR